MVRLQANQIDQINETNTVPPSPTDDSTQGFNVGDEWLDSNTNTVYKLLAEPSTGNAIWSVSASTTSQHPVNIATVDPTVNDDAADGFVVGDHWVNTAAPSVWQIVDVTAGAAVWLNLSEAAAPSTQEAHGLVTLLVGGCPELVFSRGGCVLSLRNC